MMINGFRINNDITNKKFGRLLAIEPIGKDKKRYTLWKYVCDCGNEVIRTSYNVTCGHVRSCGCLQKEIAGETRKKPSGEASLNALIISYKNSAKRNNREYALSREEFIQITSSDCYYCGESPFREYKSTEKHNGHYKYNGIDRVDNSKGYVLDNCVPCCANCNRSKRDRDLKDFLSWIDRVYNHMHSKED